MWSVILIIDCFVSMKVVGVSPPQAIFPKETNSDLIRLQNAHPLYENDYQVRR